MGLIYSEEELNKLKLSIIHSNIDSFKPTFLMVKKHCISGLKYFCKTTSKDPDKYKGSGTMWKKHLNQFGKQHVINIWVNYYESIDELVNDALNISFYHNIAYSDEWANMVLEDGLNTSIYTRKRTSKKYSFARTNLKHLSEADAINQITEWCNLDMSGPKIAKLMGVSQSSVSRWLKILNISRRTDIRDTDRLQNLTSNMCLHEISELYNITVVGLVQICKKHNIQYVRRNYKKYPRKIVERSSITGQFVPKSI